MVNDDDDFRRQIQAALAAAPVVDRPAPQPPPRAAKPKKRWRLSRLFRRRKGLPPPGERAYGRSGFRV